MVTVLVLAGGFVLGAVDDPAAGQQRLSMFNNRSPRIVPLEEPLTPLEQELLDANNAARVEAGLTNLEADATLVELARERAQDMAENDYFSHATQQGETVITLLKREDFAYRIAGENIARNNRPDSESVESAMDAFLGSSDHRGHVLNDRYERIGVGSASGDGYNYFVVVFTGD